MDTKRHRRHAASTRGFTLIEMIAVLVIIGMMVGFGGIMIRNQLEDAKVKEARAQTSTMYDALEAFALNCGNYPAQEDGLGALLVRPADADGWLGPYIQKWTKIPKDPWGNDYQYQIVQNEDGTDLIQVISLGKDKQPGGIGRNADVVNGQIIEETLEGT